MELGLSPYIIKAIKSVFNELQLSVNPSFIQFKLEWPLEHVLLFWKPSRGGIFIFCPQTEAVWLYLWVLLV